jgi:hypothetical protein
MEIVRGMGARRTAWLLALLASTACGGPSFGDGDFACGPNGECPSGFVCDEGLCRRSVSPDDAGSVDALVSDSASSDGPAGDGAFDERCRARYGGAAGFVICSAELDRCEFFADTNDGTCDALCGGLGGTCLENYDATDGEMCTPTSQDEGCTAGHSSQICVCTL